MLKLPHLQRHLYQCERESGRPRQKDAGSSKSFLESSYSLIQLITGSLNLLSLKNIKLGQLRGSFCQDCSRQPCHELTEEVSIGPLCELQGGRHLGIGTRVAIPA